jgi:hypothetical protein
MKNTEFYTPAEQLLIDNRFSVKKAAGGACAPLPFGGQLVITLHERTGLSVSAIREVLAVMIELAVPAKAVPQFQTLGEMEAADPMVFSNERCR